MAFCKLNHKNMHDIVKNKQIISCISSNNRIVNKRRVMISLIPKMKIAIDKVNQICTSISDCDNEECVGVWEELDDLIEHYTIVLKEIQRKEKIKISEQHPIANINAWDVIN